LGAGCQFDGAWLPRPNRQPGRPALSLFRHADDFALHSNLASFASVGPRLRGRFNKEAKSMAKSEVTSKKVSSAASKVLRSKTATKAEKSVAASALTQTKAPNETTGAKVASAAAKILHDPKASKEAKSVAASALTQKTKAKPAAKKK
jgi:hypothetical protein